MNFCINKASLINNIMETQKLNYFKRLKTKLLLLIITGFIFNILTNISYAIEYFPEPQCLKDNILFWKKIYTEVSLKQGLIHDSEYPLIIYKKIYVGNKRGRSLSRYIKSEKRKITRILKKITKKSRRSLTYEELRIAQLFELYAPSHALKRANKRLRFQRGQKERFKEGLKRSGMYIDQIKSILRKYNVPYKLAYLPHVESSFNKNARSKVGATGLWQFMPYTGKLFLKINSITDERRDPILSTVAAAKLLRNNYEKLQSWPLAITAYNYGLKGMKRAVISTGSRDISKIINNHKSRSFRFASKNFYSCFLAACDIDQNYKKYFGRIQLYKPYIRSSVKLTNYIQPDVICKYLNISSKEFKYLNPAFKKSVYRYKRHIPKGYSIFIPPTMSEQYALNTIAKIPASQKSKKLPSISYIVKKGDYLGKIARKTGVSSRRIARANNLSSRSKIFPGQKLYIPGYKGYYSSESKRFYRNDSIYKVRRGDVLSKIASRFGISLKKLLRANNLSSRSRIYPGQRLKIPGTKTENYRIYKVRKGDVLSKIASRFGISLRKLLRANNLISRSRIYPGQRLKIPGTKTRNYSFNKKSIKKYSYRIKDGDVLGDIAKRYGIKLRDILSANNLRFNSVIYPGQIIKIPHKKSKSYKKYVYKVKKGDYLGRIAKKTGVSAKRIAKANNISVRSTLYPGQVLRIPLENDSS